MKLLNPIARRLYVRIWLALAGAVVVVGLLAGWAWLLADAQREREREQQPPTPREVLVRDAGGQLIGTAQPRRMPGPGGGHGGGFEFIVTLRDGQVLTLQMPPRPPGERRGGPPGRRADAPVNWLRPPYGFAWMLALVGVMVMIGVLPVARRLTQRLEALQRGVQRWGDGDLSARVPESGKDEVADLSRRFNAAAERVQQLMDSQAALLQSQKSLLANASHELRSPLARIRMALALIDSPAPTATRREIERSITELDQLVEEILLASRLDAREADMGTVEPVDLLGLVAEESARVGADVELAAGTPTDITVPGVAKLLRRAVRNLLENAVRHGGGAGVHAELRVEGDHAVLHIDDHGPGVPPGQQERIFEPFYRLPGASERDGGVGLGLALVRSIAQRHHGSATCANRAGGGARFTLTIQMAP
ncbi:MAG: HAMP domain-containing sensor histidine kinase [Pseudomonadota bacterium]|nr:HAMP domain-containing sensor histidine kinase [Pseudomonadota bacterium]